MINDGLSWAARLHLVGELEKTDAHDRAVGAVERRLGVLFLVGLALSRGFTGCK
jgi:hypothetical protein